MWQIKFWREFSARGTSSYFNRYSFVEDIITKFPKSTGVPSAPWLLNCSEMSVYSTHTSFWRSLMQLLTQIVLSNSSHIVAEQSLLFKTLNGLVEQSG